MKIYFIYSPSKDLLLFNHGYKSYRIAESILKQKGKDSNGEWYSHFKDYEIREVEIC